jgi:YhcH/YjgK/YiaL family protein
MITDHLNHIEQYFCLGTRIETALRYLFKTDFTAVNPGRYNLEEEDIFALVEEYQSKPKHEGFWEAHIKYLDVQYVVEGAEHMGYCPVSSMTAGDYDKKKDFHKLEGDGDFFTLRSGHFAILHPQDAHMPGTAIDQPQQVKKVVVKVRV